MHVIKTFCILCIMNIENRQMYNNLILEKIIEMVDKNPDLRFGQILNNLGISDSFYEESKETFEKLRMPQ